MVNGGALLLVGKIKKWYLMNWKSHDIQSIHISKSIIHAIIPSNYYLFFDTIFL